MLFLDYQIFLQDVSAHKAQMERIVKRNKYLNSQPASASDVELGVNSARSRWEELYSQVDELVSRQTKLASRLEKFEEVKDEVYEFLTNVEIQLISLDPYTSEEQPSLQLDRLKVRST